VLEETRMICNGCVAMLDYDVYLRHVNAAGFVRTLAKLVMH